ncbi:MAG: ABC transporter permease, partial [Candidatus Riflebacteria bacterium]|nr:ABC transporter permease [Candidatus Riflebacteria bacterium]
MLEFTFRRIVATIPVLLGIVFIIFSVLYLIPGDPAKNIAGPRASEAAIERIRKEMGLDQPYHKRLITYVKNVARGDLGNSVITGRPVLKSICEKLPYTLKLACIAMIISIILGIIMGIISAITKGTFLDRLCTILSVTGI